MTRPVDIAGAAGVALLLAAAAAAQPPADAQLQQVERLLDVAGEEDGGFEYRADRFVDYVAGDSILLEGHAVVLHRGARLEAAQMLYLPDRRLVIARAGTDSAGRPIGLPTLSRGQDVLSGERIVYDTDSGEGLISDGRIRHDDGVYAGRRIRTRSESEFLVRSGSYTTCDLPEPHFDFYSPRIKVLVGDMAIARPVYFRIAEHRLFWVPFYVFSLRQDRQSGLLTPGYGRRPVTAALAASEWVISDLGYYFAPSDYWDLTLATDLRQRSGWLTRAALAYARRYHFDGRLETRLQSFRTGDRTRWSWWLSGDHRQDLGPTSSLRASGTFQSDRDFLRNNGTGLGDRLHRTLRSNVRYDKRWRDAGWSLSAGASQTKNLDTDRADLVLPEVSLRSNRKSLFAAPAASAGVPSGGPWYTRIYYDGSAAVRNAQQKAPAASTGRTGADASLRLSSQGRPTSWLNANAEWGSAWRHANLRDAGVDGVRSDQASASATLSQTLYGQFYPRVGRVTALRHVLKPDLGLAFGAARADTGGIAGFGGSSGGWRAHRRLTLRLANTFWAKVLASDGQGEETKHRLAQLNLATAYDLDAQRAPRTGRRRPLSDLVTSLAVDAGRRLDTRVSLRSEFYGGDDHLRPPRASQVEVSSTLQFQAARTGARAAGADAVTGADAVGGVDPGASADPADAPGGAAFGYESGLQQDIERRGGRRLHLSHYYSWRRSGAGAAATRSWLRAALGGSVRRAWHVDYSVSYSLSQQPGAALLDRDRVTAELLSLQREFHDWTATLNVEPSTFFDEPAFYLKAQFKDIPQIRFERGDRRRVGT